ncbi:trehalose-phosphatase [Rhodovibrio sodomensis]|uniref:Trehalose 6-phosphate phosphatase n=1 Tax=Rhodovibrio sodomensis TaxID=1088 RepID=A0ABS1DB99_9PROT|nr:trehalose-phosphatase [Rhodovibrio sodomensis]MBK1667234.1 trehalose-phosphatase [Rhodovibrio sodomensis]
MSTRDPERRAAVPGARAPGGALPGPAPDPLDPAVEPGRWALFLDVDGTLLGFQGRPEDVQLHASLRGVLNALDAGLGHAVALVSGRTLADLDRIQAPLKLPAAGLHGLERRDADGTIDHGVEGAALDHLRAGLTDLVTRHDALWLEDKGRALAVHYRADPALHGTVLDRVHALCAREAPDTLAVLDGKMVCEVKPRHADKGSAIRGFMARPPFAGRLPVFLGDDVTDEDGFRAVNALGGLSIRVGTQPAGKLTHAAYRLADEPAVEAWLDRVRQAVVPGARPPNG